MKILVTGGAGFIASHVVDAYLQAGHHVIVIDNLSTGKLTNLNSSIPFYPVDIRSQKDVEEIFLNYSFDVVNHHAAQINLRRSVDHPSLDAQINIIGSIVLLELCRKYHVKKFIFSSSGGAVYGEPKRIPVNEKFKANPLSPYGIAKLSVEHYLEYYKRVWNLNTVILRYGNVYGPRQDPNGEAGVIAIFCQKIIQGLPCIIYGDGQKTRDYISVHDIVSANVLALSSPNGIYNLGTGHETSVNQLIHIFQKITNRHISVAYEDERKGEVEHIALSSEKARKMMGWFPTISLEKGVEEVFDWFQKGYQF